MMKAVGRATLGLLLATTLAGCSERNAPQAEARQEASCAADDGVVATDGLTLEKCLTVAAATSGGQTAVQLEAPFYDVSLVSVIANPAQYDGKHVRVIGFLRLEFEGDALYLSKSDYDAAIGKNAVWVSPPAKFEQQSLSDRYVLVEGIFDAQHTGHMGSNSGSIRDITRLEKWPSRAEFKDLAKRQRR